MKVSFHSDSNLFQTDTSSTNWQTPTLIHESIWTLTMESFHISIYDFIRWLNDEGKF